MFYTPQLGISVDAGASVAVTSVQDGQFSDNKIAVGDSLSKIAGAPIAGTSFDAIVRYLKGYPRPLIVHWTRVIGASVGLDSSVRKVEATKQSPVVMAEHKNENSLSPAMLSSASMTTSQRSQVTLEDEQSI